MQSQEQILSTSRSGPSLLNKMWWVTLLGYRTENGHTYALIFRICFIKIFSQLNPPKTFQATFKAQSFGYLKEFQIFLNPLFFFFQEVPLFSSHHSFSLAKCSVFATQRNVISGIQVVLLGCFSQNFNTRILSICLQFILCRDFT